ncbi:JAB domain-containing protein [Clostridium tetani]|uniref:JAB domain-containing protein n=1 Tax=Clostridium tetani TaxID=1513 RepID=UPI0023B93C17|nr:JAB domain-containing protein [Clostridium tetani]
MSGFIFLDDEYRCLEICSDSVGTMGTVKVKLRSSLDRALNINAKYIVHWHTHPWGNELPTDTDIISSKIMQHVCTEMGLTLLDSIIVAGNDFAYSEYLNKSFKVTLENPIMYKIKKRLLNNSNINSNKRFPDFHVIQNNCYSNIDKKYSIKDWIYTKWKIYDRWERETNKPYIFKKNQRVIYSIINKNLIQPKDRGIKK